jgi:outer membrane lipoprotein
MVLLLKRRLAILFASGLLAACATSALDTSGVNNQHTPEQVIENLPENLGTRVRWGGTIVAVTNEEDSTLIEVLSYPLARDGLPNTYRNPTGRFILRRDGFLEPQDYAPGRLLTVIGTVRSRFLITVGQTQIVVPLVRAEQMRLWADRYQGRDRPRFGFGVGISVGF